MSPGRDHIGAHRGPAGARTGARPSRAALALALAAAATAAGCGRARFGQDTAAVASSLAAIVATCAVVVGDVEVRRAGKEEWSPVTTGAVLRDGDAIRTGAGAFARVAFASGNGIELEELSSAVVDAGAAVAAGAPPSGERVTLASGVARGFFAEGAGAAAAPLRIRTAGGEARLAPAERGVRFRLTAAAAGTEIAVTAGAARVEASGTEVALPAGRAVDVRAAGVAAPVELIGFPPSLRPGVDARFQAAPALRIALAWERLDAASGYRVQIARDLSFRSIVVAKDVAAPEHSFAPPGEGMYAWRVAARDASGRQGEYGFARRVYIDAAPPKDLLVAPAADAVLRAGDAAVRFAWSGERRARAYRLVIASAPALTEREVRSAGTSADSVVVRGLAPGEYWWGVYEDDERREPLFVAPRRLVVQRAPSRKVSVPRAVNEWGR